MSEKKKTGATAQILDGGRRQVIRTTGAAALAAGAASMLGFNPWVFAQAGRKIKIGYVSPQTGPLAAFGEADKFVLANAMVALKAGIQVGGSVHPVEIIVKDSQSNPNRAAEVAGDLILKDKIDLMVVASTPETTNPVSDQCELNGVPCISSVAPWQPWFFGRGGKPGEGFKWTYHFFWGLEDIIAVFTTMWASIPTNKRVGGLFPNDGDGNAWGDANLGFPKPLKERGFSLLDPGRYQNLTSDFSAQIAAFKKDNCEIITGVVIPPDFRTFWTQARQQGFTPKIASVGKALLFPAAVEAIGDIAVGLSSEVWWSPSHPFKSSLNGMSCKQFADAYESDTKKQWTQPIGFIHALFEVAADTLKRSKSLDDKAAIRDALVATNLNTIVGPISWGKVAPFPNVAKTPLVGGQWVKGKKYKFDLVIVENQTAPNIPVGGKLKPIG
ncbi:MAG TPA: ABC transporter substrate-binding protein [Burkholderiales bacterium]|nr:ABC transporter substrate-binding protein [Burkholderiales bacterium]